MGHFLNLNGPQSGANKICIHNVITGVDWLWSCNRMDSQLESDNRAHDCSAFRVATRKYEAIIRGQMHAMVQTVFPHYATVLLDANTSPHSAKQTQKWLHEH